MKIKKNLKMLGATLAASMLFAPGVIAAENVTDVADFPALTACIASAADVCRFTQEIETTQAFAVERAVTIDFNNYALKITGNTTGTRMAIQNANGITITLKNGSIINDIVNPDPSNTVTSSISVGSQNTNLTLNLENMHLVNPDGSNPLYVGASNSATINVDKDTTISTINHPGFVNSGTATINIYGTITVDGKGSAVEGNFEATGATTINVYDGAKLASTEGSGILQMSTGVVTINGGDISGTSGIVMTKGNLVIKGGNIKGTGDYVDFTSSHDYQVFDNGAAVYVEPTASIDVDIKGGDLVSEKSYAVSAPASTDANKNLTIKIEKGTFESAKGGIELNDDEEFVRAPFIAAGTTFTVNGEPDTKVLDYTQDLAISESGVVGTIYKIEALKTENGTFTVNKNAAVGETVKVNVAAAEGYKLEKISVTYEKDGKTMEVEVAEDGTFVMPEADVKVNVTFVKVEVPADNKPDEAPSTLDNVLGYVVLTFGTLGTATIVSKKVLSK